MLSSNSISNDAYLSLGEKFRTNILIAFIILGMSGVRNIQVRRGNVVASSPYLNLFFSMFFHSFKFVKSLKSPVVALVQPPVLDDRNVVAINFISCIVESLNGSSEYRGIADIELISVLFESFPSVDGLLDTYFKKGLPPDDSLTSVQPVNLFSLFHRLSPCLKKTTLYFWVKLVLQLQWQRRI